MHVVGVVAAAVASALALTVLWAKKLFAEVTHPVSAATAAATLAVLGAGELLSQVAHAVTAGAVSASSFALTTVDWAGLAVLIE